MSDFCFTCCLADSLYIISHPISFVKRFFKTFLSFFEAFRLARSQRPFYYITLEGVCQVVFERFLRFFAPSLSFASLTPSLAATHRLYHTSPALSIPFRNLFVAFCRFSQDTVVWHILRVTGVEPARFPTGS